MKVAVFPLPLVLFPEGFLPLRIFEARYLDMVADCLKNKKKFAIIPVSVEGQMETSITATTAEIVSWDHGESGTLNIIVKGSVGHMSAFMAQSGTLLICGDAGEALGDSIYETVIYMAGKPKSLGADCIEKKITKKDLIKIEELLSIGKIKKIKSSKFKKYGSARKLYNFKIDNVSEY